MKQNILRHYDAKYACESAAQVPCARAPSDAPTDRYEACLQAFPARFRGGHILEIGAGSGLLARSLLAIGLPFESYTASEFSAARLETLRRGFADPRVRVLQLDVEAVPDELAGRFDAVIMIALIEHLIDPLRAMQQVRRVLRPGGFVLVDTPNAAKVTRRLKLLAGHFPSTASRDEGLTTYDGRPVDLHDEGHLHYFTYRSLTRMLVERCGFSRVEKIPYPTPPLPFGRRIHYALARLRPELFAELCVAAYA
ncbi:MAG: class I SAM-dependent methyltransferase [Myxococcales bacterium]|nr:class I SAM-dependent methyltransferase [Myxococcales bacterium]MDH5307551.1 class I SAM-dependent methyltransferase [Myxococcales bacterium]MDH5567623.1 class I SAM-dependent methyltransferase [Myxococcales bacterium]